MYNCITYSFTRKPRIESLPPNQTKKKWWPTSKNIPEEENLGWEKIASHLQK